MIRLRYPVGLGIAAATLVLCAMALVASAAEALTRADEAVGTSSGQPSQDQFMSYYAEINLQYAVVELVPWIVLAAAFTTIAALTLVALRSRQRVAGVPRS